MRTAKKLLLGLTEIDVSRLSDLTKQMGLTITAVIREAIRLLHKKEIK